MHLFGGQFKPPRKSECGWDTLKNVAMKGEEELVPWAQAPMPRWRFIWFRKMLLTKRSIWVKLGFGYNGEGE